MRKTLYLDKTSEDILNQMPQKKQSAFAREAIKQKFFAQNSVKPEKVPILTIKTPKKPLKVLTI